MHAFLPILQLSCCSDTIFSFDMRSCPTCGNDKVGTLVHDPPLALPKPKSMVIKPTFGKFDINYSSGCLLHCGITNAQGMSSPGLLHQHQGTGIWNFDKRGICHDKASSWSPCINIPLDYDCDNQKWDLLLKKHSDNEKMRQVQLFPPLTLD